MDTDWEEAAALWAEIPAHDFVERWESATSQDQPEILQARFRFDREAFCRFCWPERFGRPFSAFHRSLLSRPKVGWQYRKEKRRNAIAAPRGHAKSTIKSFADVIHDVVYDLERYVCIVSARSDLANDIVANLKRTFEDRGTPLDELYGPFEVSGTKTDFEVSVGRRKTIRIKAFSFGQEIRGTNHRGVRPTKIILDDAEKAQHINSSDQRAKSWTFLVSDILKCGDSYTTTDVAGTVLHPDSILANVLKQPGWTGEKWQAIVRWPVRMDLWERCREIWADLTKVAEPLQGTAPKPTVMVREADGTERPAREDELPTARNFALAFYEANRAEMDRGAEVLDPVAEPLFACFEVIWSEGMSSFLREKQNEPRDNSTSLFNPEKFARCKVVGNTVIAKDGRHIPFADLSFYGRLDPALGEDAGMPGDIGSGAGDYASIAILGRDRFGYGYVVGVWMTRARPNEQLEAIWTLHQQYKFKRFSIETNGFQALMGRDFHMMQMARKAAGMSWQIVVDEDKSTVNKVERISSLEPAIANDWLQFSDRVPQEVLGQFADFPSGSHDDGPDSIEGAWRMSRAPMAVR